jgi:hypothetical protein
MTTFIRQGSRLLLAGLLAGLTTFSFAADKPGGSFDHLRTGFPLTGAHRQVECQTCHVNGVFKGTPTQCEFCHTQGSRTATTAKPANHIQTSMGCAQCHNSTVTWAGARYNHTGVAPGSCGTCHNGSRATGKPGNHVQTTASCDTCHRTSGWIPASYNHAGVAPGSCITCHNGTTATGKPARHVTTTSSCDACHRTTAWIPASFSHASVAPGTCTTCHGVTATGKPSGHFVTARSCDACHTTSRWTPARYTHTSPYYSTHNSGVTCTSCHKGNTETITWTYGAYATTCAGCHAGQFKQDAHKRTETPTTTFYTVDDLKNCTGSCHLYNGTTGAIVKSRSGQHKSTDGGF